jgi:acetyltransferase-like isoleucine patch superfamily enzyme
LRLSSMSTTSFSFPWVSFEGQLERLYHRFLFQRRFRQLGPGSFLSPFARYDHMERISIGAETYIARRTLLQAVVKYRGASHDPNLRIGDHVYIGNGCTISCCQELVIEDHVVIGDNVYIADGRHGYEDVTSPGVAGQPLVKGRIRIGSGAWIGYGAFVAHDLELGEHAVVGANSVVTKSVPAFTVVAGSPAVVVKRYDHGSQSWVKV